MNMRAAWLRLANFDSWNSLKSSISKRFLKKPNDKRDRNVAN